MQRCLQCGVRFTYWSVMRSGMLGYKPLQCRICNATHKVTSFTPLIISLVVVGIPMISFQLIKQFINPDLALFKLLLLYLCCVFPMLLILPLLIRYERVML